MVDQRVARRLSAILAADIAGYSALMSADEARTVRDLKGHQAVVLPMIGDFAGRIIDTAGDGVLAEFASILNAVECAVAIQRKMVERNATVEPNRRMQFRIGINLGDVIYDESRAYGDGINIAARLEGIAEPGGICISSKVYDEIFGRIDLPYEDLGEHQLKNITRPVRVYRVSFEGAAFGSTALPDKPSIAVLAFDNISGDPQQEYFSDGITEDIITELSKISALFVIGRHSAFTYKGRSVTLKQVGRDLGVRYVLEGSVRKAGNRLRITAQLIDATTDHHLWAERYDRELADIFAVQEEVARSVAAALAVALKPEERKRLSRAPIANVEAYDIYLRTRARPWPPTRENILSARNAYRRIMEIDPSFAGGPTGLSLTYSLASMFGHSERPDDDARLALELAESAVASDSGFAQAYSALGLALSVSGQHDEAVIRARRAVELQPGDPDAQLYRAFTQMFAGLAEEACEALRTALRLDPQYVNGPYLNVLGVACFCAGRYEEAIAAFKRNVERGGPLAPPALAFCTASYSAAGYMEEAHASARALLNFYPMFSVTKFRFLYLFNNSEVTARVVDALRKAGLAE